MWRVKIEKITPLLWDKSLRAEIANPSENNMINDVRSRRKMLVKEAKKNAEILKMTAEYRKFFNDFEIKTEARQHGEKSFVRLKDILNKTIYFNFQQIRSSHSKRRSLQYGKRY